jgi:hypothetical protein
MAPAARMAPRHEAVVVVGEKTIVLPPMEPRAGDFVTGPLVFRASHALQLTPN